MLRGPEKEQGGELRPAEAWAEPQPSSARHPGPWPRRFPSRPQFTHRKEPSKTGHAILPVSQDSGKASRCPPPSTPRGRAAKGPRWGRDPELKEDSMALASVSPSVMWG
jgi:hypothetical protein